ncbi:hypothetical protein D5b_00031 [Faustovirus]|nr:hypothetical protein D5b_00031 [Faustovirus]AMN84878.1 hypothetical protein D6_00479 [Faustovirus]AMP43990.1 hypothetical protein PRJ_Dakar_00030 [Faustovirus]
MADTQPATHFRVPFDTGDVNIVFTHTSPNNREKATLIGYMMRNIGLGLTVAAKFNLFGVSYNYELPKDIPEKLKILGEFKATAVVNEWDLTLTNDHSDFSFNHKRISNDQTLEFVELFK